MLPIINSKTGGKQMKQQKSGFGNTLTRTHEREREGVIREIKEPKSHRITKGKKERKTERKVFQQADQIARKKNSI